MYWIQTHSPCDDCRDGTYMIGTDIVLDDERSDLREINFERDRVHRTRTVAAPVSGVSWGVMSH